MKEFENKNDNDTIKKMKEALLYIEMADATYTSNDKINFYEKSIEIYPTSDAYSYLGWMYAANGDFDKCIEYDTIAIKLDPDFGRPWADLSVLYSTL